MKSLDEVVLDPEFVGGTISHEQLKECNHKGQHLIEDCGLDLSAVVGEDDPRHELIDEVEQAEQQVREFETGATRDTDEGKLDFEGFLSPLVVQRFGEYMHTHRFQSDGTRRDSDNWQKGIPQEAYMKSGWRHFLDWWMAHRGHEARESVEEALCGLLFNVQGYLHEMLQEDAVETQREEGREKYGPGGCAV